MTVTPARRALFWYAAAVLLSLAGAFCVLKLWRADPRVPFAYDGDGLYTALWVKGIIENGWYLENARVGAPGAMNLADYPMADNLHFLWLKLLAAATGDVGLTINLYFLLTFPLAAVAALFVLRRLGISYAPALFAAVLFALLPCHFARGERHLFLAGYYLVPPAVLVALWLYGGEPILRRGGGRKSLAAVAVCLLVSSAGVYYAFFACVFFLMAGLAAALRRRAVQPLLAGAALVALVVAGGAANLAPNLLYRLRHGPNEEAVERTPAASEVCGLKIAQLVLPITGYRIEELAALKALYNRGPCCNENDFASLGAVGAAGFVALLGWAVLRRRGDPPQLPDGLSLLNLVAVLLGTIGGLGSLFSLLVTANIRAYNRVSVYIAFCALAMVAWALDRLAARCASWPRARWAGYGLLGVLMVFAVLDQTSAAYVPDHRGLRAKFAQDAAFVAAVEGRLPAGAPVLQLPYVPFPEYPPVHAMPDYDHLRPYLHSHSLCWSYGAVKGREADLWQRVAAQRPTEDLVKMLALAGFGGIYVNRDGFPDGAQALGKDLDRLVGAEPVHSRGGRLVLYDLTDYARKFRAALGEEAWAEARAAALRPASFTWEDGFSVLEAAAGEQWRWCAASGELWLENPTDRDKRVTLAMGFRTATGETARLRIDGPGLAEEVTIGASETALARAVCVPPGRHRIRFTTDAPRLTTAGDPRPMHFRVDHFSASEFDGLPAPVAGSQP
jgi:phosphoglycerol transferase